MTKKKTLVNESVIRRWGKLAAMPALAESYLDNIVEEEDEMEAGADEMEAGADEMEAGAGEDAGEAAPEEMEAVQSIVQAVVDAISQETGVDIEVEDDEAGAEGAEGEMGDEAPEGEDEPAGEEDPAGRDRMSPAGRDRMPANRDDEGLHERGMKPAKRDEEDEEDEKKAKKESLDLEVVDDEELTEAVLKRVVERLLRRK